MTDPNALPPDLEALARAQAVSVDGSYERLWVWRLHAGGMAETLRAEGWKLIAMTEQERIEEMLA